MEVLISSTLRGSGLYIMWAPREAGFVPHNATAVMPPSPIVDVGVLTHGAKRAHL